MIGRIGGGESDERLRRLPYPVLSVSLFAGLAESAISSDVVSQSGERQRPALASNLNRNVGVAVVAVAVLNVKGDVGNKRSWVGVQLLCPRAASL